jgi:predicted AAA+ superfamily ATPase
VLEGGIEGRPDNVIFYATSNRRHLLPRDMMENERSTAINPGEAVEEKVSLSDRFGLWLGFHKCSQDEYLAMLDAYVAALRPQGRSEDAARTRRWNGRRRAVRAPAASPGSSSRTSPAASAPSSTRPRRSKPHPSPPRKRG